jgi:hypothetical protein
MMKGIRVRDPGAINLHRELYMTVDLEKTPVDEENYVEIVRVVVQDGRHSMKIGAFPNALRLFATMKREGLAGEVDRQFKAQDGRVFPSGSRAMLLRQDLPELILATIDPLPTA